jgi:myo-inositol-1(or 4)-monophosphatase
LIEVDIEFVKALAREAGERALRMLVDMKPEFKADNSYVTHIDRETEQLIRGRLAERYPNYAFQGEEFGHFGAEEGPLWCVDPIDGTTNMVFGIPFWCVSIGLVAEGHPVAGAVFLPRTNEMFWGTRGGGSFCNGARLRAKDRTSLHPEDTVGFTSSAIKTLNASQLVGRIRCLGSIATEVVYAARGSLCSHVGCYEGANDLAAALCIAHEAGCTSTYLTGESLDMDTMVKEGHTRAPFVIAPPGMTALLRTQVKKRPDTEVYEQ